MSTRKNSFSKIVSESFQSDKFFTFSYIVNGETFSHNGRYVTRNGEKLFKVRGKNLYCNPAFVYSFAKTVRIAGRKIVAR